MDDNTKAIAKLKRNSRKWPTEVGLNSFKNWLLKNLPATVTLWLFRNILVKSEYMLKRESVKFFQYGNAAYGANQQRICDRMLVVAFGLISQDLDADYVVLIRNSVRLTLRDSKKRSEVSVALLVATKRLEISTFDATCWYQLSRGLFSLGYFRAAWVARENSLDLSILEGTKENTSSNVLLRRIEAHLERSEISEVNKVLTASRSKITSKRLMDFETVLYLLKHSENHSSHCVDSVYRKNYDLFRELMTNKTVAIVGPGAPHGNYRKEIDEYETVIRLKFIGNELLDSHGHHGTRTDVSFIGSISALKLQESVLRDDFANFRLILSSNTSTGSIGSVPIYEIEDDDVIYRTPTTSGIRTLKEVIKFAPSKLKVFGFDFYSSLTPYSKEMTRFYEESSWRFGHPNDFVSNSIYFKFVRAKDFSSHDPVSNFCFAQNLYRAGLFDIESHGKSILELTPYQYVERLEEMLGDW